MASVGDAAAPAGTITLEIYRRRRARGRRGIILADTKFEFGQRTRRLMLIDEVLTPDVAVLAADPHGPVAPSRRTTSSSSATGWTSPPNPAGTVTGPVRSPLNCPNGLSSAPGRYISRLTNASQVTAGPKPQAGEGV